MPDKFRCRTINGGDVVRNATTQYLRVSSWSGASGGLLTRGAEFDSQVTRQSNKRVANSIGRVTPLKRKDIGSTPMPPTNLCTVASGEAVSLSSWRRWDRYPYGVPIQCLLQLLARLNTNVMFHDAAGVAGWLSPNREGIETPMELQIRGISSSGRAVALQASGGRFESDMLHQTIWSDGRVADALDCNPSYPSSILGLTSKFHAGKHEVCPSPSKR